MKIPKKKWSSLEARMRALEAELEQRRESEDIKDSIIREYRVALADAQFNLAFANGRLKVAGSRNKLTESEV